MELAPIEPALDPGVIVEHRDAHDIDPLVALSHDAFSEQRADPTDGGRHGDFPCGTKAEALANGLENLGGKGDFHRHFHDLERFCGI